MVSPDLLRQCVHFAKFSDDALQQLTSIAEEKVAAAGDVIFAEYDPADRLYLIIRGEVNLQYEMGNGEQRVFDALVDGELAVWSSLVEPYRNTATGTAAKETRYVLFDAVKLREICESHHEIGQQLMAEVVKLLADRLKNARSKLAAV